ncbi:HAD-IIA family hydrolase [Nakamurella sp.]|uniref:HAD-IIA family hydrolase n=1 Tax=Nakamurella sp. TaxID=1869182 RepID=UPI003B3AC9A6
MTTSPTLPPAADLLRRPDRRYGNYIFDLDGTVYLGDELLPQARQIIEQIRAAGGRTVFLSNNPTKDPQMYADKLTGMGIPAAVPDIVNPVVTMRDWLLQHHAGDGIFPIGEPPLVSALAAAGLHLTDDPREIRVVVASFDRTFTYAKLQTAFDALWRTDRAILVTTNPDRYCPMPGGRGQPDAAGIVAAIEATAEVTCLVNTGKPGQIMVQALLRRLDADVRDCLMVGDRVSTDIAMARVAGMDSALVLSGDTTSAAAQALGPQDAPTWVVPGIAELLPATDPRHG